MKHFSFSTLLFSAIALMIVSCSKDKDNPPVDNQKLILVQKHTWRIDSVNTISASYNVMQPATTLQVYTFKPDTMTVKLNESLIIYNVSYEAPDKIYSWFVGEIKNADNFMTIEDVNDKNLITKEIDIAAGLTRIRYFHSE